MRPQHETNHLRVLRERIAYLERVSAEHGQSVWRDREIAALEWVLDALEAHDDESESSHA